MKRFLSLALPALALLAIYPSSSLAQRIQGTVVSVEPAEILGSDGRELSVVFKPTDFLLYEGRAVISLRGDPAVAQNREGHSLGRLQKPLSLEVRLADGAPARITIPAHRTIIFLLGSTFQIDIKNSSLGIIGLGQDGSIGEHVAIMTRFETTKRATRETLALMNSLAQAQNFSDYREAYANLVKRELFSGDLRQLREVWGKIPEEERPIATFENDLRSTVDELSQSFSVNFDRMTLAEYSSFVRDWARIPEAARPISNQFYLFRLLESLPGVPESLQEELLILTVEKRFPRLVASAERGANWFYEEKVLSELHAFSSAVKSLSYFDTTRSEEYLDELKGRIDSLSPSVRAFIVRLF